MIVICIAVIRGFNQPKAAGRDTAASADKTMLPDANFLAEKKLLGDMKSIKSLKQSGISGVFTGQAVSAISFLCLNILLLPVLPFFNEIADNVIITDV